MNSPSGAAPTFNIFEFTGAVGVASHNSARYSVQIQSLQFRIHSHLGVIRVSLPAPLLCVVKKTRSGLLYRKKHNAPLGPLSV